ncbi:MAG: hypothetical protein ABI165_09345 [Bryobacteraceae bacterium]
MHRPGIPSARVEFPGIRALAIQRLACRDPIAKTDTKFKSDVPAMSGNMRYHHAE